MSLTLLKPSNGMLPCGMAASVRLRLVVEDAFAGGGTPRCSETWRRIGSAPCRSSRTRPCSIVRAVVHAASMGTWAFGPFENDDALDFLNDAEDEPAHAVTEQLRNVMKRPAGEYIDVTVGAPAWAASELVALAFGHAGAKAPPDRAADLIARLRPKEEDRLLALEALARIADPEKSELAGLWHEGDGGAEFDAAMAELRDRLDAAGAGARKLLRAKAGDVIVFPAEPFTKGWIVVQVVGSSEVAIFEGTCDDDAEARASVKTRPARRVPAKVNQLLRRGRALGNAPLRSDLRGKKLYADEVQLVHEYCAMPATIRGLKMVSYKEARQLERHKMHGEADLRGVALGTHPIARVRSPDEREAELVARRGAGWAERRALTTPGPFGDLDRVKAMVEWIEQFGVENAVRRNHDVSTGMQGYGRPDEHSERGSYAFAALVAVWRGTWSADLWPADLAGRLPPRPDDALMALAIQAARVLAAKVITRDAELRLIWERAADGGAALHESVASLQRALA
jgi:hypothetical protein